MLYDDDELEAENVELRKQVESYRLRELADLREQLAQAKDDAAHFRAEAERNAALGRQIHQEAEVERNRLQARIQSLEQLPNAR